jgi:membrane protein DedA with SNARE-associated domain
MDLLDTAERLVASPWLYLILVVISLLDSFLPAIPSEPVLVVAGVAAAAGDASLVLVIAAVAVGAFAGDLVPYGLGRVLAAPILGRMPVGTRRRRVHDRISAELEAHAAFALITSRFVPVGRYFVTLAAGISALPFRTFALYTGIAVATWSAYIVLVGYLGGAAMQDDTVLAVGVGLVVATVVSAATRCALRWAQTRPAD